MCGLRDVDREMVDRCSVYMVKNEQREMLVECIKSTGLCFVNGRQGLMSLPVSPVKDDHG